MVKFLFDLDGLLVDSEPLQLRSFEILAKNHGIQLKPDFKVKYIGKSAKQNINSIFNTIDDSRLIKLEKEKEKIMFELVEQNGLKIKNGVKNLIDYIYKKYGADSLHIVSSSAKNYIKFFLKTVKLNTFFNTITSGEEVENGKPFPDIYILAANKLGIKRSSCIVFEDTVTGAKAAKKAGMTVIAIPSKGVNLHEIHINSDKVYRSLSEIRHEDIDYLVCEITPSIDM